MADVGSRTRGRRMRYIGVSVVTGGLVGGVWGGVFSAHSEVRLATDVIGVSPLSVGLTVVDRVPPLDDAADGPNFDAGPSNGIVRQGDPVTYVIDLGVGDDSLSDVVITLPVPQGFTVESVPDYCDDGSGFDEIGLRCHIGDLEAGRYFTRTVTMIAGPRIETDRLVIAATVTAHGGAVRVVSNEATAWVSTPAGICDPHGSPVADRAAILSDPAPADGRISGLVTAGPAKAVEIDGVDQCGHTITRTVTPVDGRFSFVGLLPGTYRITLDGRAPVNLVLQPGAMAVDGLTF